MTLGQLTPQQSVNFFQQSPETAADVNALQRQRQIAQMLAQKGIEGDQGQMVGGHFVAPSGLSRVAQLGSALLGGYANRQADSKEAAIAQRLMSQKTQDASDFMKALQGVPAQPGAQIPNAVPNDDEGNPLPIAQMPDTAAVPPDINRAIATAINSQNPQLAALVPNLLNRQMDSQELTGILDRFRGGQGGSGGAGAGALPPGVNELAAALASSRSPMAARLATMVQDASKPITVAEGGTIFNPTTNQPMFTAPKTEAGITSGGAPIPGFQESQARRAALEAEAKAKATAPYQFREVNSATGPRLVTEEQARIAATGSQPIGAQATQGLPPPQAGMTSSFQGPAEQVLPLIAAIKDPQERANAFDAYSRQLTGGGASSAGGPGIPLRSEEQTTYGKERAKDFAGQASSYSKGGQQGASTLRSLDELRTLYSDPNVAKGAAAENISGLKNLASSFGVDIKGLGSEQAAQAITNKMALDLRSTADGGGMPGAMSDADREFLKALTPNLTKSPEGRNKIMDAQQKVAQRNIDVARLANQYEQQNGRIDAGFDKVVQDYAAKNQLFTQPKAGGGFKIIGVK